MIKLSEEQVKEILYKENPEFKQLKDKHASFEARLQELLKKSRLSNEEELELHEIKKQKLILKDKMYQMIREYRETHKSE
ncbi:conserved hypothetical protein [Thermotomaculum hydrothermale]|uniref:DUF465 domain-containing protein n=1 Tax=Thermotomaculum hydrothermale TaxID=981385 RepID=A0A7R6PT90_9BACT|nr:YdcH family protein [Thermotomaculum hydrothermale]BBB32217.1 conserved hypothetical protein [Thermotomaculum hydrothermale]